MVPKPLHFPSTMSKVFVMSCCAFWFPSYCTALVYSFSSLGLFWLSCLIIMYVANRRSRGSKPATTVGSWYFCGKIS